MKSCGETDEDVISALMSKLPEYGLVPFWVRRESDGFILNRIWAYQTGVSDGGRGRGSDTGI
ncbi:MAG TPA: hypothetical protein VKB09_06640, partial [Thermomicrobiales bacterium]|nr:hypothetical protein [Thermomicrobiales bacterium]